MNQKSQIIQRLPILDTLRGSAVIWMIIFHIAYDLKMFGYNNLNFNAGFWNVFPRFIAFTFLFCVGLSLHFAHFEKFRKKEFYSRIFKLLVSALSISLITYLIFPSQWIYFGTLHCILVGSVLGVWFVRHRIAAFVLMLLILVGQYLLGYDIKSVSSITQKYSMDFIPIYPWFWVILMGILVAPYLTNLHILNRWRCPNFLKTLGQNSLMIYLLHQPLIFGFLHLINYVNKTL